MFLKFIKNEGLFYKKLLLAVFTVFIFFIFLFLTRIVAEKYFFDTLFYRKSIRHGYYEFWPFKNSHWNVVRKKYNSNHRNNDLLNLVDVMMNDKEAIAFLNKKREEDVFKIALVGDSMFFGTGVKKNQTLAFFLQKELGRKVRVYSYSYPGDDILDNYVKYKFVEEYLKPNLFILDIMSNDLIFDEFTGYPVKESEYKKLNFYSSEKKLIEIDYSNNEVDYGFKSFLNELYYPSLNKDTQNYYFLEQLAPRFNLDKTILLSYGCPEKLEDCLEKVRDDCSNDYFDEYEACLESKKDNCLYKSIYYKYLSVFSEEKTVLDFCDLKYESISKKEVHPSATTNKNLAKALADLIREKYLK